jgi:hypothetical protein
MSPLRSLAVFLLLSTTAVAESEKPQTIALDKIWAEYMPGTRNVRELESVPEYVELPTLETLLRDSLVARISHALSDRPTEGEKAGPAFIVTGTGKEALRKTADVLTKKVEPAETFPPNIDLTFVFYPTFRTSRFEFLRISRPFQTS